ncbi:MAG: hypothetical protein NVS2B16_36950 [Chloroflexota bacterium]
MDTWEERGFTFIEEPMGDNAVTVETALEVLHWKHPGTVNTPPTSMRYGRMSARSPASYDSDGTSKPMVWDREVWVITFPNQWLPHGRAGVPHSDFTQQSLDYVLDGSTGAYIFAFGP